MGTTVSGRNGTGNAAIVDILRGLYVYLGPSAFVPGAASVKQKSSYHRPPLSQKVFELERPITLSSYKQIPHLQFEADSLTPVSDPANVSLSRAIVKH